MSRKPGKKSKSKKRQGSGSVWIPLAKAEARPELTKGKHVQVSACQTSGEVFVRPIVGRHVGRSVAELRARLSFVLSQLAEIRGPQPARPSGPLWMQLEYLENVLDFEIRPPCACGRN